MDNQRALRAEQSLLGALLIDNAAWDRIADLVSEADFCRADHRAIFAVIATLAGRADAFDPVTVANQLTARQVDGARAYLGLLYAETPSAVSAATYARIVREQSILRQLVATCGETIEQVTAGEDEPRAVLESAVTRIAAIAEQSIRGTGPRPMRALVAETIAHLDETCRRTRHLLGLSTGYADLDKLTAGLKPGELIILAARPSMGKSTLAMNLAEAVPGPAPALVFSLEMSARSLTYRLIASQGRVDHGRLQSGAMDEDEWQRMTVASAKVQSLPIQIDDAAGLTLAEIAARARRVHRECGGIALIIVDYLQLIATTGKAENRNIEVMRISQGLKALAKALHVPVVALSQLNRGVEQRTNRRPVMADLRDSGSIEQDADVIAFLYRDEVYHEDSPDQGTAELIIAKQRNGSTGMVRLGFAGKFCRFDPLAYDWQSVRSPEPVRQGKRERYEY